MGGSDNKGDGLASQPRRYQVPGQPLLNRHQVGAASRSPDGLFAQQEREPIRGRPTVRGKRTYGGQRVEEQGTWASQKHSEAGCGRPVDRAVWTAKTVNRTRQQPAHPQYANYWAPLTRTTPCHIQHSPNTPTTGLRERGNDTSKSTGRSGQQKAATRHNMRRGERGTVQGPVKRATTRRNVTRGVGTRPRYLIVRIWRRLLLILTLWGPERVLVVSTEPSDDLSCWTTPGVGRPGDGPLTRGAGGCTPPPLSKGALAPAIVDRPQ